MGWCHEFGPQISESCNHPMQAGPSFCSCAECGALCEGRFAGCPEVWARGPRVVEVRAATTDDAGRRSKSRGTLPVVAEASPTPVPARPSSGIEGRIEGLTREVKAVARLLHRPASAAFEVVVTREIRQALDGLAEALGATIREASAEALSGPMGMLEEVQTALDSALPRLLAIQEGIVDERRLLGDLRGQLDLDRLELANDRSELATEHAVLAEAEALLRVERERVEADRVHSREEAEAVRVEAAVLERRRAGHEAAAGTLVERERSLSAREEAVRVAEADVADQRREVAEARQVLDHDRLASEERRRDLEAKAGAHADLEQALRSLGHDLDERADAVVARELAVDIRSAELDQRQEHLEARVAALATSERSLRAEQEALESARNDVEALADKRRVRKALEAIELGRRELADGWSALGEAREALDADRRRLEREQVELGRQRAVKRSTKARSEPLRPVWREPKNGSVPRSHPVKVKLKSGLYHVPGMAAYRRTQADRLYPTAGAAEADGFTRAKR